MLQTCNLLIAFSNLSFFFFHLTLFYLYIYIYIHTQMQTTTIILQIRNLYCIFTKVTQLRQIKTYFKDILQYNPKFIYKEKKTIHIQTTTTTKKHTNNSKQNKTYSSSHPANKCKLSNIKGRVSCKQNIVRCLLLKQKPILNV